MIENNNSISQFNCINNKISQKLNNLKEKI